MIRLGSYPYTLGIPFACKSLPNNLIIEDVGGLIGRLRIKRDEKGNIFLRYKHFPISWGPYVFVGHAKKEDPTQLIIRLGPLTFLSLVVFIGQGLVKNSMSSLFSAGIFIWFFLFFISKRL